MRKIMVIRYFGLILAWATGITWFLPNINLPIELFLSPVLFGGLLFAIPDNYRLNNHKASGWSVIIFAIGGFVLAGRQFETFLPIAMLVMFPLVITGAALAGLQDRNAIGNNG